MNEPLVWLAILMGAAFVWLVAMRPEPCPREHVTRGRCTLAAGHSGRCKFKFEVSEEE